MTSTSTASSSSTAPSTYDQTDPTNVVLTPVANLSTTTPTIANTSSTISTAPVKPQQPDMQIIIEVDKCSRRQRLLVMIFFFLCFVFIIYLFCSTYFDTITFSKDGFTYKERT